MTAGGLWGGSGALTQGCVCQYHPAAALAANGSCPRAASSDRTLILKLDIHMNLDGLYSKLRVKTGAKLALVVLDGLGDIATGRPDSSTPLEAAATPDPDALTQNSAQGRMI